MRRMIHYIAEQIRRVFMSTIILMFGLIVGYQTSCLFMMDESIRYLISVTAAAFVLGIYWYILKVIYHCQ